MYLCIEVKAKITVTTPKIAFHLVKGCYCHNHCMLDTAPNLENTEEWYMPNLTFYGERKQRTTKTFVLFLNFYIARGNSTTGEFAYI